MSEDRWAPLVDRFVDGHYGSLRGRVRTYVIDRHLRWHLPEPPAAVVDVGGGAGHQVLPLARDGYQVTILDPSAAMLARADELLSRESDEVRARVTLVQAAGEDAPAALGSGRLDVDTRADTVDGLSETLADSGVEPVAWYGVRLFTDGWASDRPPHDGEDDVLAVELEASRRDPYRQLSRLFHLIGVRQ